MTILIYIFPMSFRHRVRFMRYADVGVVFVLGGPPVPATTMSGALSECVQVFDIFPVGDGHQSVSACSSHGHGSCFSEICHLSQLQSQSKKFSFYSQPHFSGFASASFHMFWKYSPTFLKPGAKRPILNDREVRRQVLRSRTGLRPPENIVFRAMMGQKR